MKYLAIVAVISTIGILTSCNGSNNGVGFNYEDGCPESRATMITGLSQSKLLAMSEEVTESGLVQFDRIYDLQPVRANQFMLAVVANAQFTASLVDDAPASLMARIGKIFVRDAYALSCLAPGYVSTQLIANITITSDAAVSVFYPAGSNLADVFRVGMQSTSSPQAGTPTGVIVARAPENRETITEYLSAQPVVPLLLAMTLDIEDVIASQHVFTITYTLEDRSVYTSQTEPVSITPSITL